MPVAEPKQQEDDRAGDRGHHRMGHDQLAKRLGQGQRLRPEATAEGIEADEVAERLADTEQGGEHGKREIEQAGDQQAPIVHCVQCRGLGLWLLVGLLVRGGRTTPPHLRSKRLGAFDRHGVEYALLLAAGRPAGLKTHLRQAKQPLDGSLDDIDVLDPLEWNRAALAVEKARVDADLVAADPIFESPPLHQQADDRRHRHQDREEDRQAPSPLGREPGARGEHAPDALGHAAKTGEEEQGVQPFGRSERSGPNRIGRHPRSLRIVARIIERSESARSGARPGTTTTLLCVPAV